MKRIRLIPFCLLISLVLSPGPAPAGPNPIRLTILYDNYTISPEYKAEWGFSCLFEGKNQRILFDTGRDEEIFNHNLTQMGIDLKSVDAVVISHNHSDHTGNLFNVLKINPSVAVYLPASFPKPFADRVEKTGAKVIMAAGPMVIDDGLFLTGDIPAKPKHEQAMLIRTDQGLVVIAGCAHPGIATIVQKAKAISQQEIYLVLGGFHLLEMPEGKIRKEIEQLKRLGVRNVGPTHCTGELAMQLFKSAYGDHYFEMGVGRTISLPVEQKTKDQTPKLR